jgi:putative peptidoglycan lipid II flippase
LGPSLSARRVLGTVAGAAGMIAVLTIFSRVVGFGRWLGQNYAVGDTAIGDAYATANTLPNVLFEVAAGGALAGAVVPLLAGPLAAQLRADVDRIASALLTWALAVLTPIAIGVAVFAEPIIAALPASPGLEGAALAAQVEAGRYFLVVFAPQIVMYGVGVVLTGVLQAQRKFFFPAFAPLLSSAVVIVAYIAFGATAQDLQSSPALLPAEALRWLAWGTTAGVAAMSLPLLVPVLRSGVRLRLTFRFPPGVAVRARNLAAAGIGALLAQQLAVLVTLALAKAAGPLGTYNVFQYAQAVYFLPYAVLAVPLATAAFPRLAARAAASDAGGYARIAAWSTSVVTATAVLGAGTLVAAAPAVQVVFAELGRGDAAGMTDALTWMAPGLVGFALVFHVTRALYAVDRGRAAVTATAAGWLTVVVASLVAVRVLVPDGGDGPAVLMALSLGNTVGMTLAGAALLVALARVCGGLPGLARTTLVASVGAVLGALVGRWSTGAVLDLAGSGVVAALLAGLLGASLAALSVAGAMVIGDGARLREWRSAGG